MLTSSSKVAAMKSWMAWSRYTSLGLPMNGYVCVRGHIARATVGTNRGRTSASSLRVTVMRPWMTPRRTSLGLPVGGCVCVGERRAEATMGTSGGRTSASSSRVTVMGPWIAPGRCAGLGLPVGGRVCVGGRRARAMMGTTRSEGRVRREG
jgi:hypothetical protein